MEQETISRCCWFAFSPSEVGGEVRSCRELPNDFVSHAIYTIIPGKVMGARTYGQKPRSCPQSQCKHTHRK